MPYLAGVPQQQQYRWRSCRDCGACLGEISRKLSCSDCAEVRRRAKKARSRKAERERCTLTNHRKRARHYGVEYEPVRRADVCERDDWRCGICGLPIDPDLAYPDLLSASLDHRVPMALGGPHTYANCQAAHFICNSRKSHTVDAEQAAAAV